jgi:hypothetical protein
VPFGEEPLEAVGFEERVLEVVAGAEEKGGVELVVELVVGAGQEGAGGGEGSACGV